MTWTCMYFNDFDGAFYGSHNDGVSVRMLCWCALRFVWQHSHLSKLIVLTEQLHQSPFEPHQTTSV